MKSVTNTMKYENNNEIYLVCKQRTTDSLYIELPENFMYHLY